MKKPFLERCLDGVRASVRAVSWVARAARAYVNQTDPVFRAAFPAALILAAVLFVRSPLSNYIFDEQEALLANPYVNGDSIGFFDVLERDFWGLPPDRSIGSYRPIPNLIWRCVWKMHRLARNPWLLHVLNVVIHAINGALVAGVAFRWTQSRAAGWHSGAVFLTSAVLTEAVTGVVGLADVLGGLGVLLAVASLSVRLWLMPIAVFLAFSLGFFSKESTLVAVPLIGWAALVLAPLDHPSRPLRAARAFGALVAAIGAMIVYTEVRRRFFPVSLPEELARPLVDDVPAYRKALHAFLRWFAQPKLPRDVINNPLVAADVPHRVAAALSVYAKGLGQTVFPWTLSGDYSYAAETVPKRLYSLTSVAGGLLLVGPPVAGFGLWITGILQERRQGRPLDFSGAVLLVLAVTLVWVPVAYFPHSNIAVLLPTVRAERFWYLPMVAIAWGLGVLFVALLRSNEGSIRQRAAVVYLTAAFLTFQAIRARVHALDYSDDLAFWRATAHAAPRSAKAHLNYGVMLGARGALAERLEENRIAKEIAPEWPMAHVYYGDTLCRLKRYDEAWPHYVRGFELGPNDRNLIALGLQCLWDGEAIKRRKEELLDLAAKHPGSWLAYLARDIIHSGDKHKGVDPQYRPRGYNEGSKDP